MRISGVNSYKYNYGASQKKQTAQAKPNNVGFGKISKLAQRDLDGFCDDYFERHEKEPNIGSDGWYLHRKSPMWDAEEEKRYLSNSHVLDWLKRSEYVHLKRDRISGALYVEFDRELFNSPDGSLSAAADVAGPYTEDGLRGEYFGDMLNHLNRFDTLGEVVQEIEWCAEHKCKAPDPVFTEEELEEMRLEEERNRDFINSMFPTEEEERERRLSYLAQ